MKPAFNIAGTYRRAVVAWNYPLPGLTWEVVLWASNAWPWTQSCWAGIRHFFMFERPDCTITDNRGHGA